MQNTLFVAKNVCIRALIFHQKILLSHNFPPCKFLVLFFLSCLHSSEFVSETRKRFLAASRLICQRLTENFSPSMRVFLLFRKSGFFIWAHDFPFSIFLLTISAPHLVIFGNSGKAALEKWTMSEVLLNKAKIFFISFLLLNEESSSHLVCLFESKKDFNQCFLIIVRPSSSQWPKKLRLYAKAPEPTALTTNDEWEGVKFFIIILCFIARQQKKLHALFCSRSSFSFWCDVFFSSSNKSFWYFMRFSLLFGSFSGLSCSQVIKL